MANRPEVLSTKNTSPETPMQFAACRNVGRAILPAGPISIGPSRREGGLLARLSTRKVVAISFGISDPDH